MECLSQTWWKNFRVNCAFTIKATITFFWFLISMPGANYNNFWSACLFTYPFISVIRAWHHIIALSSTSSTNWLGSSYFFVCLSFHFHMLRRLIFTFIFFIFSGGRWVYRICLPSWPGPQKGCEKRIWFQSYGARWVASKVCFNMKVLALSKMQPWLIMVVIVDGLKCFAPLSTMVTIGDHG